MIEYMDKEKAKLNIKRNLWRWGFSCRDVEGIAPYDLLVKWGEKTFKVKVSVGDRIPPPEMKDDCDVIAMVVGKRRGKRFYALGDDPDANGIRVFNAWKETPLGVFRDAKREPSD